MSRCYTLGLALTLALAVGGGVQAAEYFVRPDGDDKADGASPATAVATIQKAVDRLKPGDTLTLAPGRYAQQARVTQSGTAETPITIRAAIPGFSALVGSVRLQGFEKVAGTRFVWAVKLDRPAYRVIEADTQAYCFPAPSLRDMDQFRASALYDEAAKTLYVHTSDGVSPDSHVMEAYVLPGYGIEIGGSHVVVEGLVIRGFCPRTAKEAGRGFGMRIGAEGVVVRNCTFLFNGGGVTLNAQNSVVRDSLFVGNVEPGYGELAQIYNTSRCDGNQALNNVVLDGQTHGVRFYNGAQNCTAIGNIVKNSRIGLYFKATGGSRVALRNVCVDCSYWNFHTGSNRGPMQEDSNTFQKPSVWDANNQAAAGPRTLVFGEGDDPRFADPDNLDYRLQADSPYRGKGPDGADLGAYPYEPVVFFVRPDGDDAADGLGMARAFRTVARAMKEARAGVTIYLAPGRYDETLRPAASGSVEKPLVIRGRGKDVTAAVAGLDLSRLSHIVVEGLRVRSAVALREAQSVRIERCVTPGVALESVKDVWLRRLTVWDAPAAAARVDGASSGVRITSCVLHSRGGPALVAEAAPQPGVLFADYNDYVPAAGHPLAQVADKKAADMAALRALVGGNAFSLSADPKWAEPATHDGLRPESACVGAGELHYAIGAASVRRTPLEPDVTEVTVRQVTPTTASVTWWTPNTSSATWRTPQGWWKGHPVISELHYGTTPECPQKAPSWGDLYHRVTLKDLKPGRTYYFRPAVPAAPYLWKEDPGDPGPPIPERLHESGKPFAAKVQSFSTPAADGWKAAGRTLYVSPGGDPAADGLKADKPTTLTAVSDLVRAGDTVVMLPGEYREAFIPAASGAPGAPITLKAQKTGAVVLDGSAFYRPCGVALMGVDHVVIDGLVFRRHPEKGFGCRAGLSYSQVLFQGAHDVTVRNCVFAGWGSYVVAAILRTCGDVTFANSVFTGFESAVNGRDLGNLSIVGNTFYLPLIGNIGVDTIRPGGRLVIKNNLFHGQEKQKICSVGLIRIGHKEDFTPEDAKWCLMDYNAWFWGDAEKVKGKPPFIGLEPELPKPGEPGGVARLRKLGLEAHGVEPTAEQVKLAGPPLTDFLNHDENFKVFAGPIIRGEMIPTLEMFDLPTDSPLNKAGENGAPIGARPVR